jgi:hypothetical protein
MVGYTIGVITAPLETPTILSGDEAVYHASELYLKLIPA